MLVTKEKRIHAAHVLDLSYENSICRRVHGHEYVFELQVAGDANEEGMVVDYADVGAAMGLVLDEWDHRFLCPKKFILSRTTDEVEFYYPQWNNPVRLPRDDVAELACPQSTAENLAIEFLHRAAKHIPDGDQYKYRALVKETHSTSVLYPESSFVPGEEIWSSESEELW